MHVEDDINNKGSETLPVASVPDTKQDFEPQRPLSHAAADACIFPPLNERAGYREDIREFTIKLDTARDASPSEHNIPQSLLYQAAWAVLLNIYFQAEAPLFALVDGTRRSITSASITGSTTVVELVKQLRDLQLPQSSRSDAHSPALFYNTALHFAEGHHEVHQATVLFKEPGTVYDIVLDIPAHKNPLRELSIFWRSSSLDTAQAKNILHTFEWTANILAENYYSSIGSLDLISTRDRNQILRWNSFRSDLEPTCLHDLILRHANSKRSALAIDAWNGKVSYHQLDRKSAILASKLIAVGVGPETPVPILYERNLYSIIAIIGILRAGGAWVPLETSHPPDRWQAIVNTTRASIGIASALQADKLRPLVKTLLVVDESFFEDDNQIPVSIPQAELGSANAENAACILFTSGSTGIPKGVVHRHRDLVTNAAHQNPHVEINSRTRSTAHIPYSFVVSVLELWTTLIVGGCVCIPSDWDRMNDLPGFIRRFRTNWIAATPSLFTTWTSEDLRGIKTVFLAGEKATQAVLDKGDADIGVVNCYGSTEGIAHTIIKVRKDQDPAYLGHMRGSVGWVVDPYDHNRLVPVGAIGEMVIEGFNTAREYINNPEQTNATFIRNPKWYSSFRAEEDFIPLLKTGDLVRLNSDGSLTMVGRKDFQVKLRGQRIEPGEVEFHLRKLLPSVQRLAVELVHPSNVQRPMLMAFVEAGPGDIDSRTKEEVLKKISDAVPPYMVPSGIVSVNPMPLTISNKINRKDIRKLASVKTVDQLLESRTSKAEPTSAQLTATECRLASLWRTALNLQRETEIGGSTNFIFLGGDSLAAMSLANHARKEGFSLEVSSILLHPVLSDMACFIVSKETSDFDDTYRPYMLLRNKREVIGVAIHQLRLADGEEIEDIYPSTPFQEATVAATQKNSGAYVTRIPIKLGPSVDINRLKLAWSRLVSVTPVLRTRFVQTTTDGLVQVVLREQFLEWSSVGSFKSAMRTECTGFGIGTPMTTLELTNADLDGVRYMLWTVHHSVFDGWSVKALFEKLNSAYREERIDPSSSFPAFVQMINDVDRKEQEKHWTARLSNARPVQFPSLPSVKYQPRSDQSMIRTIQSSKRKSAYTISTKIQAAWAMTIAQYTTSSDVVFGLVQTGRSISLPGIQAMVAPAITTLPYRVTFNSLQSIQDLLDNVQQTSATSIPFQHTGIQNIEVLNEDTRAACKFQNMLLIQPETNVMNDTLAPMSVSGAMPEFNPHALLVECQLSEEGPIGVKMVFDSHIFSVAQAEHVLDHFETVLERLFVLDISRDLKELRKLSDRDEKIILTRNKDLPATVDSCVHELVYAGSLINPTALAVESHDGRLTHFEVDSASRSLAHYLISLGVGPNVIVPFCMEKSIYAVICMLGILKAGGALCPLSVDYPAARNKEILTDISAHLVLTSPHQATTFQDMVDSIVVISKGFVDSLPAAAADPRTNVCPEDTASIIFTSGSTGTPKGVVQPHKVVSSNLMYCAPVQNASAKSRVFQFAAFTFDLSFGDIFGALMKGACVVLPSEDQRRGDVGAALKSLRATQALMVPTVASEIDPRGLENFESLYLGGEFISEALFYTWKGHAKVFNVWGATELSVLSSCNELQVDAPRSNINGATGCRLWLVNPANIQELVPIGAVGELIVEGPTVAKGYWNRPDLTAKAFIDRPEWLTQDTCENQLFRIGDLARRDPNGDLVFIGRKDNQVKVNGLRMELGEVEYHLRNAMPEAPDSVTGVISPIDEADVQKLCAFIPWKADGANDISTIDRNGFQNLVRTATKTMSGVIPKYMVPTVFVPMAIWPKTATGKTDRRALARIVSVLTIGALNSIRGVDETYVEPNTAMQLKIRDIWAAILKIPTSKIGLNSDFFERGGNSLSVMRLVSLAFKEGVSLVAGQVFANPKLEAMAAVASRSTPNGTGEVDVSPFSLLQEDGLKEKLLAKVEEKDSNAQVNDIYPCTPWQVGLIWVAANYPRREMFVAREISKLSPEIDLPRLQQAWERVFAAEPILRTQFLANERKQYQVVLDRPLEWIQASSLDDCLANDKRRSLHPARFEPLNRFYIIDPQTGGQRYLIWTTHHSIFDGWTVRLILSHVATAYASGNLQVGVPYSKYVHYITHADKEGSKTYFANLLQGAKRTPFPSTHPDNYHFLPKKLLRYRIDLTPDTNPGPRLTTLLKIAWGILISRALNAPDVVFANTTMGRNASLPDAVEIAGPMLGTTPVRMHFKQGQTLASLITEVREQANASFAHEHVGIQGVRGASTDAANACDFVSLLVIQPETDTKDVDAPEIGFSGLMDSIHNFNVLGVTFDCTLTKSGVDVMVSFDEKLDAVVEMQKIVLRFESLVRQLVRMERMQGVCVEEVVVPSDLRLLGELQKKKGMVVEEREVEMKGEGE